MGNRNVTLPVATAVPGIFNGGDPFLASDYIPDISAPYGQLITVHIAITGASVGAVIRYSKDGGGVWINFLNGEPLTPGSGLERQILLRFGDVVNFSSDSDIILAFCEVDLV